MAISRVLVNAEFATKDGLNIQLQLSVEDEGQGAADMAAGQILAAIQDYIDTQDQIADVVESLEDTDLSIVDAFESLGGLEIEEDDICDCDEDFR